METITKLAKTCRVAGAYDLVLNHECCYTFHSPYTTNQGIVVNLNTFMGTIQNMAFAGTDEDQEGLFVRIVKERRLKKVTENDADTTEGGSAAVVAPTKLGLGVEGGFQLEEDKYETISKYSVVHLKKEKNSNVVVVVTEIPYNETEEQKNDFPMLVTQSVDSIINHVGISTQQNVKEWQMDQDEIPISKYANDNLPFVDNGIMIDPNPSTWKCQKNGSTDNLWLNLSDGYIGGGRQNWDGSGGSNGALDHYQETHQQYPLVVKLGTITADLNTADCYSYALDEDGPVKIPNLPQLLAKRGIHIGSQNLQKTVKSTAELEVELNATYAFDKITEAGAHLVPMSGPSLQGLYNLGNSCYMNSVLQLLFSGNVIPELAHRYGVVSSSSSNADITQHLFLTSQTPKQAPDDILVQTTKVACALTSGVFAAPLPENGGDDDSSSNPKYRLSPRMIKHIMGKNHVEFCTGHQQDAAEYLLHFLEKLDRAEKAAASKLAATSDSPIVQRLVGKTPAVVSDEDGSNNKQQAFVASHLFAFETCTRSVCSADEKVKYRKNPRETIFTLRIPMDKAVPPTDQNNSAGPDQKRLKPDIIIANTDGDKQEEAKEDEEKVVPTVPFMSCVDQWAADEAVAGVSWDHLNKAVHTAIQQTRFQNFPRYLLVQLQRYYTGPGWTEVKLEVNIDMPKQGEGDIEIDLTPYKVKKEEGEVLLPETDNAANGKQATSAPAAAPSPPIDEMALTQLMDMGFSLNSCKRALTAVGGSDVAAAMDWAFQHNTDADFNDPLPESTSDGNAAATSSSSNVDEGVVQSLVENLGCFTADQVRSALQETNGAADRAADWLFSHMDDLDGAIAALQLSKQEDESSPSSSGGAGGGEPLPLEDSDSGKYTLSGMISHIGRNTGSGHYVAHLKRLQDDGKWVIFNDEKVALSSQPPVEHAYIYLFQRSDTLKGPLNPHY